MEAGAPRYRIGRRIGRGGMAEVFEGTALGAQGFERRVAIKRLNPDVADDASFRRQFLDEARIASQLHHANIVAVLDFGLLDGVPFQVLELVDGADAGALLRRARERAAPMPVAVALYACAEVARALAYAHAACDPRGRSLGIVHRDVSPQNVLVAWSGEVKLTDFGIAFAHDRSEQTLANVVKGKAAYMAPEQWLGRFDARTDVFALGCVLHALVAGQSPLAPEGAVQAAIAGAPVALDDALPDDVRGLVARALAVRPEARFESAGAFASALDAAVLARAPGGGRAAAGAWLAGLRPAPETEPAVPARARGLDVLLGLAADDAPDARGATFVTRPALEAPPLAPQSPPAAQRIRRTKRTILVVVPAALLVALVASFLAPARRAAPVAAHETPRPRAPEPPALEPPAPAPVAPSLPRAVTPSRPSRPPAVTPHVAPAPAPAPAPAQGTGWLVVAGPGAVRGLLVIDGTRHAEAQQLIALPLGHHHLELRPAGGGAPVLRDVELVHTDTRASPRRWVIE